MQEASMCVSHQITVFSSYGSVWGFPTYHSDMFVGVLDFSYNSFAALVVYEYFLQDFNCSSSSSYSASKFLKYREHWDGSRAVRVQNGSFSMACGRLFPSFPKSRVNGHVFFWVQNGLEFHGMIGCRAAHKTYYDAQNELEEGRIFTVLVTSKNDIFQTLRRLSCYEIPISTSPCAFRALWKIVRGYFMGFLEFSKPC